MRRRAIIVGFLLIGVGIALSRRLRLDEPSACGQRERLDARAHRAQSRALRNRRSPKGIRGTLRGTRLTELRFFDVTDQKPLNLL
jgi:hypothetical protein